jgi:glyoxylase-like metal-dependent hydrolase (beta-lactamase superfamily II)
MEEKITQIIPNIWQLCVPIPAATQAQVGQIVGATNIYLIRGKHGWLLVDTGWDEPRNLRVIHKGLDAIGIHLSDINQIIVTHFHLDHFGLASKLKNITCAKLALHQDDFAFLELMYTKGDQIVEESRSWLLSNGTQKKDIPDDARFVFDMGSPDFLFLGGETISTGLFEFEVLWTPGHTQGHICLYERRKKLFISGDHMLEGITPEVGTTPLHHPNPLGDYLDCLEHYKQLEVELVLPAHGSPFSHYRKRIKELIEHHKERKNAILKLLEREPMTAYNIAAKISWIPQVGGVPWKKLDAMNRRFAVFETWAHLRLLENEGKVTKYLNHDLVFYLINRGRVAS